MDTAENHSPESVSTSEIGISESVSTSEIGISERRHFVCLQVRFVRLQVGFVSLWCDYALLWVWFRNGFGVDSEMMVVASEMAFLPRV